MRKESSISEGQTTTMQSWVLEPQRGIMLCPVLIHDTRWVSWKLEPWFHTHDIEINKQTNNMYKSKKKRWMKYGHLRIRITLRVHDHTPENNFDQWENSVRK